LNRSFHTSTSRLKIKSKIVRGVKTPRPPRTLGSTVVGKGELENGRFHKLRGEGGLRSPGP